MKLIIAGSRDMHSQDVTDRCLFELETQGIINTEEEDFEIVSGGARGPDSHGEILADQYNWKVKRFPADWGKHGRAAGHIRNRQMGDYADALLAIWDGQSKGTKGMVDYMRSLKKPVYVFIATPNYSGSGIAGWDVELQKEG